TAELAKVCWTRATPIGATTRWSPAVRRRPDPGPRGRPLDQQDRAEEHFPLLVLDLETAQVLLDGTQAAERVRAAIGLDRVPHGVDAVLHLVAFLGPGQVGVREGELLGQTRPDVRDVGLVALDDQVRRVKRDGELLPAERGAVLGELEAALRSDGWETRRE